jgi:hypothetical protein
MSEGKNSLSFWAISSWGDTSEMGSTTAWVDSQLPTITGTLSGSLGSNGWYVSPVSFNGSASDTTSGLASFTCTLDGGSLPSCNSVSINTEGSHTLVFTARDNVGNTRTLNQSASLDTQNPVLTASLVGTLGTNSWYNAVTLKASASDPTPGSGLSAFEYTQDGSSWMTFPASGELVLPDGHHKIDLRAVDHAGRTVSASKSFWLDSIAPEIILDPSGTLGANNWYTTDLSLVASSSDGMSGISLFEYKLNSGSWVTYSAPLILHDGTHVLTFWVQDASGLVTQETRTYQVDTVAPQISGSLSGVTGVNGWYVSNVILSASAADPAPGSGLEAFTYALNGASANPYTDALTLSDGGHSVQLSAQDEAGLTYSMSQSLKVDTRAPALNIETTLPNWVNGNVTINGAANDPMANAGEPGSGLSKVEVSTNGGQVWQATTGNASWSYTWDTTEIATGIHVVRIHATDNAGLTTEQNITVGIDNTAPKISLPDSWFQWDTVTLDIWDNHSDLAEARVEISDPEGRWPMRKIRLGLESLPMDFKWDRRFGDGTLAPLGTYDVQVIAFDRVGNVARKNGSINILLSMLPAGPTSTAQSYVREEATPHPATTAEPLSTLATPQIALVSEFGSTSEALAEETAVPENIETPREAPTQTSVLDWLESVFVPGANTTVDETSITTSDEQHQPAESSPSDSNLLWGAAATAMVGAATAYALDEKRKREEEIERKRAEIEASIAEQQARKIAEAEARKVAQWLEGQALLKEQIKEQKLREFEMANLSEQERLAAYKQTDRYLSNQARMADWQVKQEKLKAFVAAEMTEAERLAAHKATDEYKARQAAAEQYQHEQRVRAADTARWEGLASQGEYAANLPRETWWEQYGEWVHGALDVAGFVPGFGEIADGLNGLIYLAEGRYVEASISALAMIPVLGDLGKAGKLTIKIGKEVLEEAAEKVVKEAAEELLEAAAKEAAEEVVEKAVKETTEELVEKAAKETVEEAAEKTAKEAVGELAEKAFKETAEEVSEKALKEAGEELVEVTSKEAAEKTTKEVSDKVITDVASGAAAMTPASIKNASQTVAEKAAAETLELISEETTQRALKEVVAGEVTKLPADIADGLTGESARELAEKLSTELGGKKVWVSAENGMVYVSASTDEALMASKMLKDAVASGEMGKIEELAKVIASGSTRGSGDRLVLGAWEEGGGYIGDAVDNGGVFFDIGNDAWTQVKNSGIDPWLVNEQFLQSQLEAGVKRIDFMGDDIFDVLAKYDGVPNPPYRVKEIDWLLANAKKYGYVRLDNSWVKSVL